MVTHIHSLEINPVRHSSEKKKRGIQLSTLINPMQICCKDTPSHCTSHFHMLLNRNELKTVGSFNCFRNLGRQEEAVTAWSALFIQLTDYPRNGRFMRDQKGAVTVLTVPWWYSGFQKNKPSTPGVRERPFSITETPQLLFVQACPPLSQTHPKAGGYSWGSLLRYRCVITTLQGGHQSCSDLFFVSALKQKSKG